MKMYRFLKAGAPMLGGCAIVMSALALVLACAGLASATTLTDLGAVNANAINSSGQVAGCYLVGGTNHAFIYSGGVTTDIGSLLGNVRWSSAYGINDSGQVVGQYQSTDYTTHGFLYSNGAIVSADLGVECRGINGSGQVVGTRIAGSAGNAFIYSGGSNGTFTDLGILDGIYSQGWAINGAGQATGSFTVYIPHEEGDDEYIDHAFLYSGGTMHDLGVGDAYRTSASGINSKGWVVGRKDYYASGESGESHAFIYKNSTMYDLTAIAGYSCYAQAVNTVGQVVGGTTYTAGDWGDNYHAYAYFSTTGMVDLNTLVSGSPTTLTYAAAINDAGTVLVRGENGHSYLLTLPRVVLPGDADYNGTVNGADLNTVLSNYNKTFTGDAWVDGDFDKNGTVNGADLNVVLSNYNQIVGVSAAVPEPSALLLLAAGLVGLAVYGWRKK